MMHFFRRSKIHLDVFTCRKEVIETAPIDYAHKFLPTWWKKLPKEYFDGNFFPLPTMKTCEGVRKYYASSIAMPLWSELWIKIQDKKFTWQYADRTSLGVEHSHKQYGDFVDFNKVGHLKIVSPWFFKTKEDVNWMYSNPMYNTQDFFDFSVCPGIVNFKRQGSTHAQAMINLSVNKTISLPFNTPLAFFTPLSDKKIVLHRHLITNEAFYRENNSLNPDLTFINSYLQRLKHLNKCPYKDETK